MCIEWICKWVQCRMHSHKYWTLTHWQLYIFKEMGRTMLRKYLYRFIRNTKKGGRSEINFEIQSTCKIKKIHTFPRDSVRFSIKLEESRLNVCATFPQNNDKITVNKNNWQRSFSNLKTITYLAGERGSFQWMFILR